MLENYFLYSGGGFPLASASFQLFKAPPPRVPNESDVTTHLQRTGEPVTPERVAAELAQLEAAHSQVQDAYARCPYQIGVYVGGHAHTLIYRDALRFLLAIGVLRRCTVCGTETLFVETDTTVCGSCGYRAS
jgi:hypothetical protein